MLRKLRIFFALIFWVGITLLFLDFTGAAHAYLGWMAKVQFLPALLAVNLGVVAVLVVATLIFGRVYCSVICPLGVMQDFFAWLGRRGKRRRNKYSYSPERKWLRYSVFAVFIVALIAGIHAIVALLAPYSAYGRIASSILSPLYDLGNNVIASIAESAESYSFYRVDVWIKSVGVLIVAAATVITLFILAWRNGRTYCNTICPVGTLLGLISRFSLLRPVIDTKKCVNCGLCARRCKASCIDSKGHQIDYSRCVACMDCISTCREGAISYTRRRPRKDENKVTPKSTAETKSSTTTPDNGRRAFMAGIAVVGATAAVKAKQMKVDGGLAVIEEKKIPVRQTPIVPPGAVSLNHLADHCTACQLCVSACPNGVLRPSTSADRFMQPESSYERGYCRPECTRCSHVCPTGAILPITREEKTAIQIGRAVWLKDNCIVTVDGVSCGLCARRCPAGAITMVTSDASNPESLKIPAVDTEKCIGCGACENLCPARPFSAIYVEGNLRHRDI